MSNDKYQRLRDALAAGEFDFGQVCCGDGVWSGHPAEPPECCGQPLTAADDIRALLDERDRLHAALVIAREYVADEIAYLRAAFRGYEELGKVPDAEADLAQIDAALGGPNAHP